MDAAVLTMVTALFAAVLASAFDQRREAGKTRDKLDENSAAIRELAARVTILEAGHQSLHQAILDNRRVIEKNHAEMNRRFAEMNGRFEEVNGRFEEVNGRFGEVNGGLAEVNRSLADARERLARIEGHLGIGFQPSPAA